MNKKPEIFKPKINHRIDNNDNAYYSFLGNENKVNLKSINEQPIDTLNRLIKTNAYLFNKKVSIITKDKTYLTSIAGKMGKKVITLDGDSIDIEDILKIDEK